MNGHPKRKRRRRLLWGLLVVAIVAFSVWFGVQRLVKTKVLAELARLQLGAPEIDSVSIGLTGLKANHVRFRRDPSESPWLTIEALTIHHPLGELVSGTKQFNSIELNSFRAEIDLDAANVNNNGGFDLSAFSLPAKSVAINDAILVLRKTGKTDFVIDDINLALTLQKSSINVEGRVGALAAGIWNVTGELSPVDNELRIAMDAENLELQNGQWQHWPYLPAGIEANVGAAGRLNVQAKIVANATSGLTVAGNASIQQLELEFPVFNLPLKVTSGEVELVDQTLIYTNIHASADSINQIVVNGETKLNQWPIVSTFGGQVQNVNVATVRKLVTAIPTVIDGRASGEIAGSVAVARDLRTTLELTATVHSSDANYASVAAETLTTEVRIDALIFDQLQQFESLAGETIITAQAAQQPLENVFNSFELGDLNRQLEISGVGSAAVNFRLPLKTAEDLSTWRMKIEGTVPKGKISGQHVSKISVAAELKDGRLQFSPITATPVVSSAPESQPVSDAPATIASAPKLDVAVDWPLVAAVENKGLGKGLVTIVGESMPTSWLSGFLQRQSELAESISPNTDLNTIPELTGDVDLNFTLAMPAATPDQIVQWTGDGSIRNTRIVVGEEVLQNLSSDLRLNGGLLQFSELNGAFERGGSVSGSGHIDLVANADHQMKLNSQRLPLRWLITLLRRTDATIDQALSKSAFAQFVQPGNAGGEIAVNLNVNTRASDAEIPWDFDVAIDAAEIKLGGNLIRNLKIKGDGNSKRIDVESLHAEYSDQGMIDGAGSWEVAEALGSGALEWKRLPIDWLARFSSLDPQLFSGTTDGSLKLSSRALDQPNDKSDIPFDLTGSIVTDQFAVGSIKARPFGFNVSTRGDRLHLENFRLNDDRLDLGISAQVRVQAPHEFEVTGKVESLRLSRLTERPSVTEKAGTTSELTGLVSSKFRSAGQLNPFDWQTSGELLVSAPAINGSKISDISASWTHIGNDWKQSSVEVTAFGGTIKMVELASQPQRVRAEISDIDAVQVTEMMKFPVRLSGKVNGSASLNEWRLLETRWADINLTSASLLIGPTEFGEFTAKAEYRKRLLTYDVEGTLLAGRLKGTGSTELPQSKWRDHQFPAEFKLSNIALNRLYGESNFFRSLRPLAGGVSAAAAFTFGVNHPIRGNGRVSVSDFRWNNEMLTRDISVRFNLNDNEMFFDDVRADLKRGSIAGQARWPLKPGVPGTYELDIRQLDMRRIADVFSEGNSNVTGLLDARINGQLDRQQISGQGYVGVARASIAGIAGQSFRLPIQFQVAPQNQAGRIELRRSTFRLFDGNASGTAKVNFGPSLSLETDLKLTNVDTGKLLAAVAGFDQADQGKLTGRLILSGKGVRSTKDLNGSFKGKLERASVFQLPVLKETAKFLAGNSINTQGYDSDQIYLRLTKGRVQVKSLNFFNSLVKIAITGDAFLDGRLDLKMAARVESLNQPKLLDQLAGSPLAQLSGSPVVFFTQAAEFLSDRMAFLQVKGTFRRPQIRVDSGQQLREEAIRYFLRGSQILPYELRTDN